MTKPFLKSAVLNASGARRGRTPRKLCDGTNAAVPVQSASSMGAIIDLPRGGLCSENKGSTKTTAWANARNNDYNKLICKKNHADD